jgi:hypothetical protein
MMQSLFDYAATHQQQHNHIHFSIATPPNEPEAMQVVSSGPPPPPAPEAGAIRRGRARAYEADSILGRPRIAAWTAAAAGAASTAGSGA